MYKKKDEQRNNNRRIANNSLSVIQFNLKKNIIKRIKTSTTRQPKNNNKEISIQFFQQGYF